MKIHFGHLLGLSALAIAGCAAFFSVYGISQLFAGAFIPVVIMASALEFGKLVAASYLQRYWSKIAKAMKAYVVVGVIVLVGVTSAGIYGFLSNAYQQTANSLNVNETLINNIELKKARYTEELAQYTTEREQLTTTINELAKGLANNVIQYKDRETGEIITTTSSNTRRVLEGQLEDAKEQRDKITPKMDIARDSITAMDLRILDLKVNDEASAELGPLIYISKLMEWPMDKVVNYFIILLVFVFDPMAIVLVLATNWVFEEERKKRLNDIWGKTEELPKEKDEERTQTLEDDILPTEKIEVVKTEEDAKVFFEEIENPQPPNEALKEASNNYKENITEIKHEAKIEDMITQPPKGNDEGNNEDVIPQPIIKKKVDEPDVVPVEEEVDGELPPPATPGTKQEVTNASSTITQTERPVAKNGIVKPPSSMGVATRTEPVIPTGSVKREEIKQIKQGNNRRFTKPIPRRRGNQ